MKILEVTPKYNREHEMPEYVWNMIKTVQYRNRVLGKYISMSKIIETMPKVLMDIVKSGKKVKSENKIRGLEIETVVFDELVDISN